MPIVSSISSAIQHRGERDLAGRMRAAFVCNNAYHLAVARSVSQSIEADWDLHLFGRPEILKNAKDVSLPVWRRCDQWLSDGSLRTVLAMSKSEVSKKILDFSRTQYEFVFYFIDKEPTNQLFLRQHPESCKVLIQEGIGLYNGKPMAFRERAKKSLVWSWRFQSPLRSKGMEQGANLYHDHLIARWPQALPSCKVGRAKLHGYEQAMPAGDYLRTLGAGVVKQDALRKPFVLFVGSPIVNMGWVTEGREAEIIRGLLDATASAGGQFYVKPHPRETVGKYERIDSRIHVVQDSEPVESFCLQHRPQTVVSFMSSALLNLFYEPRLVYLYELVDLDFPNKSILRDLRDSGCDFEAPANMEAACEAISLTAEACRKPRPSVGERGPYIKDVIERIMGNA